MIKVKTTLIASGSGTDADAIMRAWKRGCIPNIDIECLISTKKDAGCLQKAQNLNVDTVLLDSTAFGSNDAFNRAIFSNVQLREVELIFLVGCIVKIRPIEGIAIYNIHPAGIAHHGGDGMYGLAVHKHVLSEIVDQIKRGRKTIADRFFTYPTVHEVELEYDSGAPLLVGSVEIPQIIILELSSGEINLYEAAQKLQNVVLPYEWNMLPCAVLMAAQKILNKLYQEI